MDNKARICAVAALLLLALAVANYLMSAPQIGEFGVPTYRGDKVRILLADVPSIGDFYKEFEVNKENPFVPINDRLAEKERRTRRTRPATSPPPIPVVVANLPPPRPPIVVAEPPKPPPLELPPLSVKPVNPPNCVGLIVAGGQQVLVVRMGKDGADTKLKVGDKVEGWELTELRYGTARFRDPAGNEQLYVIGLNEPAAIQGTAPEAPSAPSPDTVPSAPSPPSAPAPPANPHGAPPASARAPGGAAAAAAPVGPPGTVTPGIQPPAGAPKPVVPPGRGRLGTPPAAQPAVPEK